MSRRPERERVPRPDPGDRSQPAAPTSRHAARGTGQVPRAGVVDVLAAVVRRDGPALADRCDAPVVAVQRCLRLGAIATLGSLERQARDDDVAERLAAVLVHSYGPWALDDGLDRLLARPRRRIAMTRRVFGEGYERLVGRLADEVDLDDGDAEFLLSVAATWVMVAVSVVAREVSGRQMVAGHDGDGLDVDGAGAGAAIGGASVQATLGQSIHDLRGSDPWDDLRRTSPYAGGRMTDTATATKPGAGPRGTAEGASGSLRSSVDRDPALVPFPWRALLFGALIALIAGMMLAQFVSEEPSADTVTAAPVEPAAAAPPVTVEAPTTVLESSTTLGPDAVTTIAAEVAAALTATTLPPTTLSAPTEAPTTLPATTLAPTTLAPTTLPPTTLPPTTTLMPTTLAPTTVAATTVPLPTLAPTTLPATTVPVGAAGGTPVATSVVVDPNRNAAGDPVPEALTLYFDVNATTLSDAERGKIPGVVAALAQLGVGRYQIIGHADPSGQPAVNARLSQERAQTVADALRSALGAQSVAYQFEVVSAGARVAVVDKDKSRRVTIERMA